MTIKTFAAVVGTLAIIVVLFFITKITTPSSSSRGEVGFFRRQQHRRLGSWNRRYWFLGTYPGGRPPRADASVSNSVLLVEPKLAEKVEPKPRRERARR